MAVSWAAASKRAGHSTLTYTLPIVAMFAVSAIYHRVHWESTAVRNWMRRLDHSMIFVLIAGSYTPFARLDMPRAAGHVALAIAWGGALAGIALTLFWPTAPRWLSVALYLLLGWVAVWYTGMILHNTGVAATVLLAVEARCTALVRCFMDCAGLTPGRRRSVITSCSTCAPRSRRSANTSPSGWRSSRTGRPAKLLSTSGATQQHLGGWV